MRWQKVCKVWLPAPKNRVCGGRIKSNGKCHVCQTCGVSYGLDRRTRGYRMFSPAKDEGVDSQDMVE